MDKWGQSIIEMSDFIGYLNYFINKQDQLALISTVRFYRTVDCFQRLFKEALVFGQCEDLICYFLLGEGGGVVNNIILGGFIFPSETLDQL
jgi:hypothetical protein